MENKKDLKQNIDMFGPFIPYLENPDITDMQWNGRALWVTDVRSGDYRVENVSIPTLFIEQFTNYVANFVSEPFNKVNNKLEAETDELRITIAHESIAISGRDICIRKTPAKIKNTITSMLETKYCTKEILALIINCVIAKMNIIFCGQTGVGKTECLKFFTQFINDNEKVITIEDSLEVHYGQLYPNRNSTEYKVNETDFTYRDAIKLSLRQRPAWIMITEVRASEIKYLLESWITGINGFLTIHTDDVRHIATRVVSMSDEETEASRLEAEVYEFANIGILIRFRKGIDGIYHRYIDQLCFFSREEMENKTYMIMDNGKVISHNLPPNILLKLKRAGITDPFSEKILEREMKNEKEKNENSMEAI